MIKNTTLSLRLPRVFAIVLPVLFLLSGCSISKDITLKKKGEDRIDEYLFRSRKAKKKYITAYNSTLKLWKIPFEEIDVPTDYGNAHVIVSGPKSGKPIILMHGMDASSTMWYPNVKAWSRNYRVYAVDFIMDAGKSKFTGKNMTNDDAVKFYQQVFDHFKIKKPNLVATSRGGWMAAYMAMQPDTDINTLVLLSPAQMVKMIDFAAFPALVFKMFPNRKKLKATMAVFAKHPEKIHRNFKEQFYIASKFGGAKSGVLKMVPFSNKELESLKMPVLFLAGDSDIVNDEKSIREIKEHVPNAQAEIIPDSGHFMNTDQSELINKKVLDFLNKN